MAVTEEKLSWRKHKEPGEDRDINRRGNACPVTEGGPPSRGRNAQD